MWAYDNKGTDSTRGRFHQGASQRLVVVVSLAAQRHPIFNEDAGDTPAEFESNNHWKVLIVDDDSDVHEITKMALGGFEFQGEPLQFISAYSADEARQLLAEHPDTAVMLLDVVMETDDAGLQLVRYIRQTLNNPFIRIILRTGQPGQAPEKQVVLEYDINDYKEKTELTSKKLYTCIYTALSSYRALTGLDSNRRGLVKVIEASARIYEQKNIDKFIQGVLEQVVALLFIDREAVLIRNYGITSYPSNGEQVIMAAIGEDRKHIGQDPREVLPAEVNERIQQVLRAQQDVLDDFSFTGYVMTRTGVEAVIHVSSATALKAPDHELLELFFRNITVGLENLNLWKDVEETQTEIVYLLGDVVETRSNETGNHVRRVAEIARQLAMMHGMAEDEATVVHAAAPLHDVGKIGIPDAILNKNGKLTDSEWETMKTHTDIGGRILSGSKRPVMQAAAIIAKQHHENWDGSGYPSSLTGEGIHIYARLVAIADVMDALCSERCYKSGWTMDRAMDFLLEQSGIKFDPALIELVTANRETFEAIRARYPEH